MDEKLYQVCEMYYWVWEYGGNYISRTYENIKWWSEHDNLTKDSTNRAFAGKHLCHTSQKTGIRKNREAIFIALLKPISHEKRTLIGKFILEMYDVIFGCPV